MNLQEFFRSDSDFLFEKNIFYQAGIKRQTEFEKKYVALREKEGRVYTDEIVKNLPYFPEHSSLYKEWLAREVTLNKLIAHLNHKNLNHPILELGCGNGWLAHNLAISLKTEVCAMDINEIELSQGARLFEARENLTFIYADIFTAQIKKPFGYILLASSVQYFPNLLQLIDRLFDLLTPSGEIHIVDSPWHTSIKKMQQAKKRSYNYFHAHGSPEMVDHYFHQGLHDLKNWDYQLLFDPHSLRSLFARKISKTPQMAFPWILIKRP